jgi:hypothetical protein
MPKELDFTYDSGATTYVNLTNATGQWYNTVGASFEAFNGANWTDYDLAATEAGTSGAYFADMPSVGAGVYHTQARRRAGGSPAQSDAIIAVGDVQWDGSRVVLPLSAVTQSSKLVVSALGIADANLTEIAGGILLASDGGNFGTAFSALFGVGTGSPDFLPVAPDVIIAAAILDLANGVETGKTVRQALRAIAAALAGKVTGGGAAYAAIGNPATLRLSVVDDGAGDRTVTPTL